MDELRSLWGAGRYAGSCPTFNVVLIEPQIPPNTGNIARMCAAMRVVLHLVGKLGFEVSDRALKRAGLDYWEWVDVRLHADRYRFFNGIDPKSLHFFSKKAERSFAANRYRTGDYLVFGNETEGLPDYLRARYSDRFFSIPILEKRVRSLNLASAVAIVTFEALRQNSLLDSFQE